MILENERIESIYGERQENPDTHLGESMKRKVKGRSLVYEIFAEGFLFNINRQK